MSNDLPPLGRLNGGYPKTWIACRWCYGRVRPAIHDPELQTRHGAIVCEKCDQPEPGGLASWPEMFN